MKLVEKRLFANPEVAARELLELANAFKPVQHGRTYVGSTGHSFPSSRARPLSTKLVYAIAKGWLILHESGTYVRFTEAGAARLA